MKELKFESLPEEKTIELFIAKIFNQMKLANEVAICSLIFIETLVVRILLANLFRSTLKCRYCPSTGGP